MDNLRDVVMTMLIFSAVIMGMSMFYTSLVTNYSMSGADSLASLNQSSQILDSVEEMQEEIDGTKVSGDNSFFIVLTAPWKIVKLTFDAVVLFQTTISDVLGGIMGIPTWFADIVWTALLVVVIFSIVSAVFRWKI